MQLPIYVVDAFTGKRFSGNPAAVCPVDTFPEIALMQSIAAENNLAETAFVAPFEDGRFRIRWFTPTVEVDLCGHATLAAAHVLWQHRGVGGDMIRFESSNSGPLPVRRAGDRYVLDFPAWETRVVEDSVAIAEALGARPVEVRRSRDILAVFPDSAAVRAVAPDMKRLKALDALGIIVTAPGEGGIDFVSRFFAPGAGIDEDPVTGSAHCTLAPYWAERLGKTTLAARQISGRGGELWCEVGRGRVQIGGHAVTYLTGQIEV